MSVRCKFSVWSNNEQTESTDGTKSYNITMGAVTNGSTENKQYWHWTPAGHLTMNTVNEDAAKQFEVGKEYYIDITPAE